MVGAACRRTNNYENGNNIQPSSAMGVEITPALPVDVDVMVVAHLKM